MVSLLYTYDSPDQLYWDIYDRYWVANTVVHRPYVFTEVCVWVGNGKYSGYGFAKCQWPDEWNPELGIEIAEERALEDLAKLLTDMWKQEDEDKQYASYLLDETE